MRSAECGRSALRKLFEAELLIALRETELRSTAVALARAAPSPGSCRPLLEPTGISTAAEAVPSNAAGLAEKRTERVPEDPLGVLAESGRRDSPGSGTAGSVRWWPNISRSRSTARIRGRPRPRPPDQTAARPAADPPPDGPPLLRYRLALCSRQQREALEGVRAEVPAFVETSYFLGQIVVATIMSVAEGIRTRWSPKPSNAFRSRRRSRTLRPCCSRRSATAAARWPSSTRRSRSSRYTRMPGSVARRASPN